jgi:amino acid transporter
MNIKLKVLLYVLGFGILFINVKIAFVYLIICQVVIYVVDKHKDKQGAPDEDSRNLDEA